MTKLPFKTFPEFSNLTLADREVYEDFIENIPPTVQFSFPTLMMWWGSIHQCKVAVLHDNLVFAFWLPGSDRHSGLSVLGTRRIDETICEIFDHQRSTGKKPRLVYIPDFVTKQIRYPDLFSFQPEPEFDEAIINVRDFTDIQNLPNHHKSVVRRYSVEFNQDDIVVEAIDLSRQAEKENLIFLVDQWKQAGPLNDYMKYEQMAIKKHIDNAMKLDLECICLFIKSSPEAFFIFQRVGGGNRVHLHGARFSYKYPHMVEMTIHRYAQWLTDNGVDTVNIDSDLGIDAIREQRLSMSPSGYTRMYTVTSKNLID